MANFPGLSRIKKGLTQNGLTGGSRGVRNSVVKKKGIPRGNLRSGSVAQFLNTMTLCAIFFGMVRNKGHDTTIRTHTQNPQLKGNYF